MRARIRAAAAAMLFVLSLAAIGCSRKGQQEQGKAGLPRVVAVETFLADVAGRAAAGHLSVEALLPVGADPHSYEPAPMDVAKIAGARLVIANGAGLEGFLGTLIRNASADGKADGPSVLEASHGLAGRSAGAGEVVTAHDTGTMDPHFFLDPVLMITYVENIRDAFRAIDGKNAEDYRAAADAYIKELRALDRWIAGRVEGLPQKERLLVTNHESLGYFADRYGFTILGSILPGTSSDASTSARQLAALTERLKRSGVKAIFLETGTSSKLAEQVASEAGIKTVTELYTHSLSDPGGPAATYIDMMRYNTDAIVEGLK
jgi:ABC-type Zn uptake system ZnuABC Zn-binding protein ZnuA